MVRLYLAVVTNGQAIFLEIRLGNKNKLSILKKNTYYDILLVQCVKRHMNTKSPLSFGVMTEIEGTFFCALMNRT